MINPIHSVIKTSTSDVGFTARNPRCQEVGECQHLDLNPFSCLLTEDLCAIALLTYGFSPSPGHQVHWGILGVKALFVQSQESEMPGTLSPIRCIGGNGW